MNKTYTTSMRLLTQFNKLRGVFLPLMLLLISNLCYAETVIDWNAGATIRDDEIVHNNGDYNYRIKIHGDIKMNGFIKVDQQH